MGAQKDNLFYMFLSFRLDDPVEARSTPVAELRLQAIWGRPACFCDSVFGAPHVVISGIPGLISSRGAVAQGALLG